VYGAPQDAAVVGGESTVIFAAASARVTVFPSSLVSPYVTAGFGFFRMIPDDIQIDNNNIERVPKNTSGAHAGLGLDLTLGSLINVFAEAGYVGTFTEEGTAYWPMRLGLMFELGPQEAE
jgi:hypothetical protein